MYIKHTENGKLNLIFIRYLNISDHTNKIIGFSIIEDPNCVFQIMLQALTDFTIPKSYCHLYYEDNDGNIRYK